jgi:hypothetical protein
MAKELVKGELADFGLGYEVKIESGEVKISANVSLLKLVDKAADQVNGGALEVIIVQLVKEAIKGL